MELFSDMYGIKAQALDELESVFNLNELDFPYSGPLGQLAYIFIRLLKIQLGAHESDFRGLYYENDTYGPPFYLVRNNFEYDLDEGYWGAPDFREYEFLLDVGTVPSERAIEIEQIVLNTFKENAKLIQRESRQWPNSTNNFSR